MNRAKIERYLRKNPHIFEERIPDERIPDLILFLYKNRDLIGNAIYSKKPAPKRKPWYHSKTLLAAAAAALALALFFGATSKGRAVAGDFFETVVQYFNGGMRIQHGMKDPAAVPMEIEQKQYTFSSLDEAEAALGVRAARIEGRVPVKITATTEDGSIGIRCWYELPEGNINLSDNFALSQAGSGIAMTGDGRVIDIQFPGGLHFYGSCADKAGYAVAYHERRTIEASSRAMTYDDFVAVLSRIRLE
jgi:hypothetical protein